MKIKSEEVNFLVYRYLIESGKLRDFGSNFHFVGFAHTAFSFRHECSNSHLMCQPNEEEVPPGALLSMLHRGLLFLDVELHTAESGSVITCTKEISLLQRHSCAATVPAPSEDSPGLAGAPQPPALNLFSAPLPPAGIQIEEEPPAQPSAATAAKRSAPMSSLTKNGGGAAAAAAEKKKQKSGEVSNSSKQSLPKASQTPMKIQDSEAVLLNGHTAEVFTCAWNPNSFLLATGAGDSSARLWSVGHPAPASDLIAGTFLGTEQTAVVPGENIDIQVASPQCIVTTLEWNRIGDLLAAGSSTGVSYLWNAEGALVHTLRCHTASVFSIRWNNAGSHLLTGSEDSKIVLWKAATGEVEKVFTTHSGSVLDVDWSCDNVSFVSCSQDKTIQLHRADLEPNDCKILLGHDQEINAVRWNSDGTLIASCSDDKTARIWSPDQQPACLFTLAGHSDGIYTVEWSPASAWLVGSASFDGSARIWDSRAGQCIFVLARHVKPVYSISWSPDGEFLATGSVDRNVFIWSARDGTLSRSYACKGGVYDLAWEPNGKRIAVCTTKSSVVLLSV